MPVQFHWDADRYLLRTVMTGLWTESELLQYIRDQWTHPERERFDQISDCRDMDGSTITPAVMQAMSGLHNELNRNGCHLRIAFIVSGTLGYGIGRQYEMYCESSAVETRVFVTMAEAEEWIETMRRAGRRHDGA
ncbi:MAG TPA: hypothetical protein VGN07_13640 [Steroidobacteraceae bacterium]|jgi:hypothetical protein